jgi:hypothetical protein
VRSGTADGFWCGVVTPALVRLLDHPKLRVEMFRSTRKVNRIAPMDSMVVSRTTSLKAQTRLSLLHFLQIMDI